ncbi:alkaline phosphatase family protein [Pelagimonas sp. KU-00592-HH]|uniref:sulfatase-like hydrolase/transferase n=1 Tax=Pelagimonas sp. KU-00592-HH TaxID=3127651 RepID=UPI00310B74C0
MTQRPNILLITADQWRGECLGALGHIVKTPHLDALAEQATIFTRHHAACAPCSPARASLYTGQYQMNTRVVRNGTPLDARFDNIAKAARRGGYVPTLFGYTDTSPDPRGMKPTDPALQSYEGVLPGMEVGQILPEDDGPWLDWITEQGVEAPHLMQAGAPEEGEIVSMAPTAFAAEQSQTAFLTGKFLDWAEGQGAPWFAHLSFLRPHPPFSVPAPYNEMYAPGDGPAYLRAETPALEPDHHPVPKTKRARSDLGNYIAGATGGLDQLDARDFDRIRAIYFGMMSEVDAQIGRLIAGLRAMGSWEDTLLVFTSDHGEMMGDHWMLGKGGYHAQSYHIPLILRVPGDGKRRIEACTSAVDIFPTLCDAMQVVPEIVPNGASLLPFARGEMPKWRDGVMWEFDYRELDERGHDPDDCAMACWRTEDHLYVHTPADGSFLFDLAGDPGCFDNIAAREPEVRAAMAEGLLSTRMRAAEQTLARHMVWEWSKPTA